MIARIRSERGLLLVTFERDGEEAEQQLVASPEQACLRAVVMLATRRALHDGDRLSVVKADDTPSWRQGIPLPTVGSPSRRPTPPPARRALPNSEHPQVQ